MLVRFDELIDALQQRNREARVTRCTEIADQVVPEYRGRPFADCTGHS